MNQGYLLTVQMMRSRVRVYGSKFSLEPSRVAITAKGNEPKKEKDVNEDIHLVAPIFSASARLLSEWEIAVTFAPKALAKSTPKCP